MRSDTSFRERRTTLSVAYGGLLVLCLLLGTKVVSLGPFATDGSQLPYALILTCVAVVTEVQGRRAARRLILSGLGFQLAALAMIAFVLALPASPSADPDRIAAFDLIVGQNPRMIVAGIASYLTVTTLIGHLQRVLARAGLGLTSRSIAANVLGQLVDTTIYVSIAFAGIFPLLPLMTGQFLVKAAIGVLLVPVLVRVGTEWLRGIGEFPDRT